MAGQTFLIFATPTKTAPTTFTIGSGTTTPLATDTAMEAPIPFSGEVLIDSCDVTTGWAASTDAIAPTVDSTTFKEGTGSLNLGKSGVASVDYFYTKTIGSTDLTNKFLYIWAYFDTLADIAKLKTNAAGGLRLYLSSDGFAANFTGYNVGGSDTFLVGFNLAFVDLSKPGDDIVGSLDLSAVTQIRYHGMTNLVGDLITLGDAKMDFWRSATEADTVKTFLSGFPTQDEPGRKITIRGVVAFTEANGHTVSEIGMKNTDSTRILHSRDVITTQNKSSTVRLIIVQVDQNTPC